MAKLWQAKGAKGFTLSILTARSRVIQEPGNHQNIRAAVTIRSRPARRQEHEGHRHSYRTGINYVILGTVAVYNPALLREAVDKYGAKIILALDVRDSKVAIAG